MSVKDLLEKQNEVRKGFYVVSSDQLKLIKLYEENQRQVLEQSLTLSKNERQSLVAEISMLVGVLTGFLALIGIGLPILNMAITREELRQDRAKYEDTINKVAPLSGRVDGLKTIIDETQKGQQLLGKELPVLKDQLNAINAEVGSSRTTLLDAVTKAQIAISYSLRLSILIVEYKLAKVMDRRLFEELRKNGTLGKLFIEMLEDVVMELKRISNQKNDFSPELRSELMRGIRQFAADSVSLDLKFQERKDNETVNNFFKAIDKLIATDVSKDEFWDRLNELSEELEKVIAALKS
jgi:hypothetical protein